MTDLATVPAADEAIPVKEPRISKRMRQAINLLTTKGMTQRDAADKAGLSETHLSRHLKKPQIQVFIARKMRETIAVAGLRASRRYVELIDASSEHVAAQVSERILTSEGTLRSGNAAQVSVNIDIKAGYVIDLTDGAPQPMRDVTPTGLTHD